MLPWLLACAPAPQDSSPGAVDSVSDSAPATVCHGAAQDAEVPIQASLDGLAERWDANRELLRILFIGSPT